MKTRFVVDLQQETILKIQLVTEWEIPKTLQTPLYKRVANVRGSQKPSYICSIKKKKKATYSKTV